MDPILRGEIMYSMIIAGLKRFRTWLFLLPRRDILIAGSGLHIGARTRLWAPGRIVLGKNVYIGKEVSIECNCRIGDYCLIANRVAFVGRNDHDYRRVGIPVRFSPWIGSKREANTDGPEDPWVVIEQDVWIGYGAILLTGINVGRGSIIAAGSTVTKDIPAYSIAAGVPARVIGRRFDDSQIREHEYRIRHGRFEFSERGYEKWIVEPYRGRIPESADVSD